MSNSYRIFRNLITVIIRARMLFFRQLQLSKELLQIKKPDLSLKIVSQSSLDTRSFFSGNSARALKTIIVCDDEPDILSAYQLALKNRYNTITAKSGNECIRKYEEALKEGLTIHAIILDYRLGDMLGDDVARKVRDTGQRESNPHKCL